MKRTTEQLLTWGPLGVGVGLIVGGHKRLGVAIAAVAPVIVVIQHPRGARRALKLVPKAISQAGKQVGRKVARGAKQTGKSISWLAS
ncbi:MAG: hypothetical protein ACRD04_12765 [Terriglobales bacterium]